MTDDTAFEVGGNVCTTPGSVVFQNELIQLIQYTPTTAKVYERPLVIVPPCINKYYILDLQPANSFVAHAVAQGHTVFLVSWRNAGAEQGKLTWDDYLEQGVLPRDRGRRSRSARRTRSTPSGFCVGGTLLASALAVAGGARRAPGGEHDAADHDAGLLRHRRDRPARHRGGRRGARGGDRQGRPAQGQRAGAGVRLAAGQRPDLAVRRQRLPEGQGAARVRPALLEQRRHQPARADVLLVPPQHLPGEQAARTGRHSAAGRAGRSGARSRLPAFVYASKEDHIVPWKTAYASTQMLGGDTTFVLGASGHIAGRHQSAGEEEAQLLGRTRTRGDPPPIPTPGSRAPRGCRAAGGRRGTSGSPSTPAPRSTPGRSSATPSSRRSRTPQAATSRRRAGNAQRSARIDTQLLAPRVLI